MEINLENIERLMETMAAYGFGTFKLTIPNEGVAGEAPVTLEISDGMIGARAKGQTGKNDAEAPVPNPPPIPRFQEVSDEEILFSPYAGIGPAKIEK